MQTMFFYIFWFSSFCSLFAIAYKVANSDESSTIIETLHFDHENFKLEHNDIPDEDASFISTQLDNARDGQPTEEDISELQFYYQQAMSNPDMNKQRQDLKNYVSEKVLELLQHWQTTGRQNLSHVRGFDMLWEGNSYEAVGYGGQFAVLSSLGMAGKRIGSSGGAASAIMAGSGVDNFLALYQSYQQHYAGGLGVKTVGALSRGLGEVSTSVSTFSSAVYMTVVHDEAFWQDVSKNTVIVCRCGMMFTNTAFYNFNSKEELIAAGYASGNASMQGGFRGTKIRTPNKTFKCTDGGSVVLMPPGHRKGYGIIAYHTPLDTSASKGLWFPTEESIEKLFKAAVDGTVEWLKNFGQKTEYYTNGSPQVQGVLPDQDGNISEDAYQVFGSTPSSYTGVDFGR